VTVVGVAKLKASLSAYLARVKAGQVVTVTEHGTPIARLVPVESEATDSRLATLERAGLIRRGSGRFADVLAKIDPPEDSAGDSLAAVLEEREQGR
jgi:prevent-host-death family protein